MRKKDGIPCHTKEHHHNDFIIKIRGKKLKTNFDSQVRIAGFLHILEESFEKTTNKKVYLERSLLKVMNLLQ